MMPWIDADELLEIWERTHGPVTLRSARGADRPLNFEAAGEFARIAGPYRYEHQSDGTTRILVDDDAGAP